MSESSNTDAALGGKIKIILPVLVLLGLLLFVLTYLGIQKSRSDSLELIRQQGAALLETLTLSSDNAIKANSLFDLLAQEKFSDLAAFLESRPDLNFKSIELADNASKYGVDAIMIYDRNLDLVASGSRGLFISLEELDNLITPEVDSLFSDSTTDNSFQTLVARTPGNISMYYLKKTDNEKHIVVIVSDALFYSSAKKDIGIGYLVQNIAREVGIEYILFQTPDGIVFSSRKIGPLLKIEKDDFLISASASDSVLSREYLFDGRRILELVKRFSSVEYPTGIFRLGISLEKYYEIMNGFNRQMIVLSAVIFAVLVFIVLYLSGKQKRIYLDRSMKRMKSLSEKVFDSVNSGLVAVRRDGTVEMVNRRLLAIFETAGEDFLGRSWTEIPFKDVIPFENVLAGRQHPGEMETTINLPSGKKYLLINIASLFDHENNPAGAVATVYDYTAIRDLEETARRKERLTELGDLAAGVAHEIRNPLNAISIAAQRLLAEFEPKDNTEEFQSFARQIKSEANRLNEIVSRFLAMTRERGLQRGRINASKIIDDALGILQLGLERRDIILNAEIKPDIYIAGTEDRLKQLVINLVKNSIEACVHGGGKVDVRLSCDSGRVIFSVLDNGAGIPDEIKKKIFHPYFTTKDGGTGLGLSIVHQIVEEFGGQIEVLTPAAGGTEFRAIFAEQKKSGE